MAPAEPIVVTADQAALIVEKIDAWSIYAPEQLTAHGLPAALIDSVTRDFESDTSDPKRTIFKDGQIVEKTRGVNGLQLLYATARAIGADTAAAGGFIGRGYQARALQASITAKIKEMR